MWQRTTTIAAGRARRGRILLLLADGMSITDVASTVAISRRFVYKWVQRFLEKALAGLADKPVGTLTARTNVQYVRRQVVQCMNLMWTDLAIRLMRLL
jgi:transposase